jgi:hypothetical protein
MCEWRCVRDCKQSVLCCGVVHFFERVGVMITESFSAPMLDTNVRCEGPEESIGILSRGNGHNESFRGFDDGHLI